MTYLAHSARPDRGIPVQEYRDHIENVVCNAVGNADRAAVFSEKYVDFLRAAVKFRIQGTGARENGGNDLARADY